MFRTYFDKKIGIKSIQFDFKAIFERVKIFQFFKNRKLTAQRKLPYLGLFERSVFWLHASGWPETLRSIKF